MKCSEVIVLTLQIVWSKTTHSQSTKESHWTQPLPVGRHGVPQTEHRGHASKVEELDPVVSMFEVIGQVAPSINYIHVEFELNVLDIKNRLDKLSENYQVLTGLKKEHTCWAKPGTCSHLQQLGDSLGAHASNWNQRMEKYQNMVPQTHTREPRQILAIGLIVFALGTFISSFFAHEVSQAINPSEEIARIKQAGQTMQNNQFVMLDDIDRQMKYTIKMAKEQAYDHPAMVNLAFSTVVTQTERVVSDFERVMDALMSHRLSPALLTAKGIQEVFDRIHQKANQLQYRMLIEYPSHMFQLETTFVRVGNDYKILLHVPCVANGGMMTLYRYHSMPMPIPNNQSPPINNLALMSTPALQKLASQGFDVPTQKADQRKVLEIVPEAEMFATNTDGQAILFTQADLHLCSKLHSILVCDKHHVKRTDFDETCLGAMFSRNQVGARRHCEIKQTYTRERVWPTSANEFIVYPRTTGQYQVTCKDQSKTPNHKVRLSKLAKLTLPMGCNVQLEAHAMDTNVDIRQYATPVQEPWSWNPMNTNQHDITALLSGETTSAFTQRAEQTIHDLDTNWRRLTQETNEEKSSTEIQKKLLTQLEAKYSDLQAQIMKMQEQSKAQQPIWESHPSVWGLNLSSTVCIVMLIGLVIYMCYRQKAKPAGPIISTNAC